MKTLRGPDIHSPTPNQLNKAKGLTSTPSLWVSEPFQHILFDLSSESLYYNKRYITLPFFSPWKELLPQVFLNFVPSSTRLTYFYR